MHVFLMSQFIIFKILLSGETFLLRETDLKNAVTSQTNIGIELGPQICLSKYGKHSI